MWRHFFICPSLATVYLSAFARGRGGADVGRLITGLTRGNQGRHRTLSWIVRTSVLGMQYVSAQMSGWTLDNYNSCVSSSSLGCTFFANKSATHVHVVFLDALRDLNQTARYAWGAVALVHMYDHLNNVCISTSRQLAGYITLLQVINMFFIS